MQNNNDNKMETMNMKKLAINMSLPMIISMIALALYNIVDGIFVSRISQDAWTALSIVAPVQSIMIAITLGTGVGINSLISRKLGEKNKDEAKKALGNGITLILISWLVVAILCIFFTRWFMTLFTTENSIIDYGTKYLSICMIFSVGMFLQIAFEKIMESLGKATASMVIQFSGAVINLILDPILIFGFGPIPALGVIGAAIATITGQFIGMIIGIIYLKREKLGLKLKDFKLDIKVIKQIYAVGFPTIILESVSAFVTLILNKILTLFSDVAVPVWGIYIKVQSFLFMIIYGLNNGMIPIIGYNYGAKNKTRIKEALKVFLILAEIIMFIGMLVFLFFSNNLLLLFEASEEMLELGNVALKTLSLGFMFAGISIILSGVFQATGKGNYSLIVFILRQLSINLPVLYLIGKYVNINLMWGAFVLSELLAMIVSIIFINKIKKEIYTN